MYTVANIIILVEKIATLYCVAALGGVAGNYTWPESIWASLCGLGAVTSTTRTAILAALYHTTLISQALRTKKAHTTSAFPALCFSSQDLLHASICVRKPNYVQRRMRGGACPLKTHTTCCMCVRPRHPTPQPVFCSPKLQCGHGMAVQKRTGSSILCSKSCLIHCFARRKSAPESLRFSF